MAAKNSAEVSVTTPTDREILITRTFDAPRHLVFEAWTNPKHVPKWMLGPDGWSMPVCELDLRPGGGWRIVWRKDNGTEMEMTGAYREVVKPERIVNTENWGGGFPETLNTITFIEKDGATTVNMVILYPSKDARDAALATGMKEGIIPSYNRLANVLAELQQ